MITNLAPKNRIGGTGLIDRFQQEMGELFGRFFEDQLPVPAPAGGWVPRADVVESEKALTVTLDLPGVAAKDVSLTVRDGLLTIEGQRAGQAEEADGGYVRLERYVGRFARVVPLPAGIDPTKVTAEYQHGVLTVTAPKTPGLQPKAVPIAVKP